MKFTVDFDGFEAFGLAFRVAKRDKSSRGDWMYRAIENSMRGVSGGD
ncbi:MAG: hypothetical protein Kow00107_06310 [Planctomycetota bacterium]